MLDFSTRIIIRIEGEKDPSYRKEKIGTLIANACFTVIVPVCARAGYYLPI